MKDLASIIVWFLDMWTKRNTNLEVVIVKPFGYKAFCVGLTAAPNHDAVTNITKYLKENSFYVCGFVTDT